MKQLTEPETKVVQNAWGKDVRVIYVDYEIENIDVGTEKSHYLGYNYSKYKFTKKDVGRKIRSDVSPDGCWSFLRF